MEIERGEMASVNSVLVFNEFTFYINLQGYTYVLSSD